MPDLSRFANFASRVGVAPACSTCSTVAFEPVLQNNVNKTNDVALVSPVAPPIDVAVIESSVAIRTPASEIPARVIAETPAKSDAEQYISALRIIGPCGYGPIAIYLGRGATRAGQIEAEVHKAGFIQYDSTGRATVVETSTAPF